MGRRWALLLFLCGLPLFAYPSPQDDVLRTTESVGVMTGYILMTGFDFRTEPGGMLSPGNNTINLRPCPKGVYWNVPESLYISGGAGQAEVVSVVPAGPGTCQGDGKANGTITVSVTNAHDGSWLLSSATSGLSEAINYACAGPLPRAIFVPPGSWATRATSLVTCSDLTIVGVPRQSMFRPLASSGTLYVINLKGSALGFATRVTANVNGGLRGRFSNVTNQIKVASTSYIAPGAYVALHWSDGGNTEVFNQIVKVKDVAGSTVTVDDVIGIPVSADQPNTVQPLEMLSNIAIRGIGCDGGGSSGSLLVNCVFAQFVRNSEFADIYCKDMVFGACHYTSYGYGNYYHAFYMENSGGNGGGGQADFHINVDTSCTISDIMSSEAYGFGPELGIMFCSVANLTSTGAGHGVGGRACKIAGGSGWNTLNNINCSGSAFTGLSLTNGSFRNHISNVVAHGNQNNAGVWTSGQDVQYNDYVNVSAFGNKPYDIGFSEGDDHNTVINADYTTLYNGASNQHNSIARLNAQSPSRNPIRRFFRGVGRVFGARNPAR